MASSFHLVDVFCSGPFSGNPVAVFDGEGLTTEEMQKITQWMNLRKSTFLLPPTTSDADYRVRIFTLQREMPFAGHPTLGTCHALDRAEREQRQGACGSGVRRWLVPVERHNGMWAFSAPPLIRSGSVDEEMLEEVADFLKIERSRIVDAQWCDNGPGWLGVLLGSADEVLALEPVRQYPKRMDVGVIGAVPRRWRAPVRAADLLQQSRRGHSRGSGHRKLQRVRRAMDDRQRARDAAVHRGARHQARAPGSDFYRSTRRRAMDRRQDRHRCEGRIAYTLSAAAASASRLRLRASWARPFRYCGGQ